LWEANTPIEEEEDSDCDGCNDGVDSDDNDDV
jgi:hypothetical protein